MARNRMPFLSRTSGLLALLAASLMSCAESRPRETTPETEKPPESSPVSEHKESESMKSPYSKVRKSVIAGSWYPGTAKELASMVDEFLDRGSPSNCQSLPLAMVLPHAGYAYSGPTASLGVAQVRGCNIRRIWVLGPTHRVSLDGVGLYPDDAFETPLGQLPLDRDVMDRLSGNSDFRLLSSGDGGEHSIEIELPILQRAFGAFELVPLLIGRITPDSARRVADTIRPELGPGDLVVISSDFTHHGGRFGYQPFKGSSQMADQLDKLDHGAWDLVAKPDTDALYDYLDKTGATICGRHGLLILSALLPAGASGTEISYTTSGHITGDWSNSVSYLAGRLDGPSWTGTGPTPGRARLVSQQAAESLLALARKSLEYWFQHGSMLEVDPETLPASTHKTLGAFVTLQKNGQLRGCIGEIVARRPAWQAVLERAVDAAIHDTRFSPVTASELNDLHLEVSLLGPYQQVDGPDSIILGRHGIVLSLGWRKATFLPQVATEQGWDRSTTLEHLARKAGISTRDIPRATIEVYEAQVVSEP